MFVHVVHAETHAAAAVRRAVRNVRCEKCGCDYRYEIVRRGVGKATTVNGIGVAKAKARAAVRAQKAVTRLLQSAVDPVPCPRCDWLQPGMFTEIRRRRVEWSRPSLVGLLLLLGAGFVGIVATVTHDWNRTANPFEPGRHPILTAWIVVVAGSILAVMMLRRLLAGLPVTNPAGPAWSATQYIPPAVETDASGQPMTFTVEPAPPSGRRPWRWVQLINIPAPRYCVACGVFEPAAPMLRLGSDGGPQVWVRFCPACDKARKRRSRYTLIDLLLISGGIGGVWYWSTRQPLPPYVLVGTVAVSLVLVVAIVVNRISSKPYRLRRFAKTRNTAQIRFRSDGADTAFQIAYRGVDTRRLTMSFAPGYDR